MEIKYYLLTKTIPEWNSKHKNLYTCSIGYSPQLGLIRVYPIPLVNDFNSGFVYDLEVQKRKTDTRARSYELVGAYDNKPKYKRLNPFNYDTVAKYLTTNISQSISDLNRRKDSIGIIPISDFRLDWEYCDRYVNTCQIGMFQDVELADFTKYTKESRQKEARLSFKDADGYHNIQFNEWGIYEYGRKFGNDEDAFRFTKNKNHVLVGNMLQFQNNWMALKFLSINSVQQMFSFESEYSTSFKN